MIRKDSTDRPIYTIGYGAREIEDILELLGKYQIAYVIDVRSSPFSSYKSEFDRDKFRERLRVAGFGYSFMGGDLGGRPSLDSCYVDGKVRYDLYRETQQFRRGLERLRVAWMKHIPIVLICSEARPESCHRSKMIGVGLSKEGIPVMHIDENGHLVSQSDVMTKIGANQVDLFSEELYTGLASRNSYTPSKKSNE